MKPDFDAGYDGILQRLRRARVAAGLSQSALAARLGLSQSWVSKIECGDRRLDVVEMQRLVRATGTRLDALLVDRKGEGAPRPRSPKTRKPGVVIQGPWRSPR